MLANNKIVEVCEYLSQGFSDRFISQRTGVSRATIMLIRQGKIKPDRKEFRKAKERSLHSYTHRDYDRIIEDARIALVKSGREKHVI